MSTLPKVIKIEDFSFHLEDEKNGMEVLPIYSSQIGDIRIIIRKTPLDKWVGRVYALGNLSTDELDSPEEVCKVIISCMKYELKKRLNLNNTKTDMKKVALEIAKAHRAEDSETIAIFFFESENEIRLVEVSKSVGSGPPFEVLPFKLSVQHMDMQYPCVVILLSPEEWVAVKNGDIKLPPGWDNLEEI